jgi:hypothetical protein
MLASLGVFCSLIIDNEESNRATNLVTASLT